MDLGIAGRRALVTGASRGIGAAIAQRLAAEGVRVVLVARTAGDLERACAEIRTCGGDAIGIAANVATEDGRQRLLDAVRAEPCDILVNNVGGGTLKPFLDFTDQDWRDDLERNLLSAVALTSGLLPSMIARGWGRIVHVGSIAAREPGHRAAPYAAAKAGLVAYSKATSAAVGRHGVLSVVVMPGLTDTSAIEARRQQLSEGAGGPELSREQLASRLMGSRSAAIRRMITPDDVAAAVLFLVSDRAQAVTGVALPVDGGTMLGVW
jgi:3-oxoacyl-[acyl-carrier protein] reductase